MVKEIVKDQFFLMRKAEMATCEDGQVITDLVDTLVAHEGDCVGLAANMIGVAKRIIVVAVDGVTVMLNPRILKKTGAYETDEGCLCLPGERKCTRYASIEVEYFDPEFKKHIKRYIGYPAEIIQHEMDHLEGILI